MSNKAVGDVTIDLPSDSEGKMKKFQKCTYCLALLESEDLRKHQDLCYRTKRENPCPSWYDWHDLLSSDD